MVFNPLYILSSFVKDKVSIGVWIKDLNVRSETIKLLEENIGKTLSDINHSRILYDPPPRILKINCFQVEIMKVIDPPVLPFFLHETGQVPDMNSSFKDEAYLRFCLAQPYFYRHQYEVQSRT